MDKIFELFLWQCNAFGYLEEEGGLLYCCNKEILSIIPLDCEVKIRIRLDNTVVFKACYLGDILEESPPILLSKVTLGDLLAWSKKVNWKIELNPECSAEEKSETSSKFTKRTGRLKFKEKDMYVFETGGIGTKF